MKGRDPVSEDLETAMLSNPICGATVTTIISWEVALVSGELPDGWVH